MKKYLIFFLYFFAIVSAFAQDKYTISGYITDVNNGESIVGAHIYCKDLNIGVSNPCVCETCIRNTSFLAHQTRCKLKS